MMQEDIEQRAADEALRKLRHREYGMASQVGAQMESPLFDKLLVSMCLTSSDFHFRIAFSHVSFDQHC